MRPKRAPRSAPHTPQRGLRRLPDRPTRPSPFGLEWSERTWDAALGREIRTVRRRFFRDLADREACFAELARAKAAGALRTLTRPEVDEWLAFRAAISTAHWTEVVAGWRAHLAAHQLPVSRITVADHAKTWLDARDALVARRELAPDTQRQTRHKVELFAAAFGPQPIARITTAEVEHWLTRRALATAPTWNNYRKILRAFFTSATAARHRADNPIDAIPRRRETTEEVGILTVPQIARLFTTARDWRDAAERPRFALCLRRLALEAFAGLRHGSANRLTPADVNQADRGIRHPAASIKTGRRLYTEGYPDNLWAWLALAPDDRELTPRQYLKLKSDLFQIARVPHPHNCLRHSFATYHLAARTNPGLTAYLLCHRNQQKLWEHYKGNATAAEGRRFESITPETCAEMAKT